MFDTELEQEQMRVSKPTKITDDLISSKGRVGIDKKHKKNKLHYTEIIIFLPSLENFSIFETIP